MIIVIVVLIIVTIASIITTCKSEKASICHNISEAVTFVSFLIGVGLLTGSFISYTLGARNQAVINKYQPIVDKHEKYVASLEQRIKKYSESKTLVINGDNPLGSLINELGKAEGRLLDARIKIDEARVEKEGLRLGVFGYVIECWFEE